MAIGTEKAPRHRRLGFRPAQGENGGGRSQKYSHKLSCSSKGCVYLYALVLLRHMRILLFCFFFCVFIRSPLCVASQLALLSFCPDPSDNCVCFYFPFDIPRAIPPSLLQFPHFLSAPLNRTAGPHHLLVNLSQVIHPSPTLSHSFSPSAVINTFFSVSCLSPFALVLFSSL